MKIEKIALKDISLSKPSTGIHPDAVLVIEMEDRGQDCTQMQVDKAGWIVQAGPYQDEMWKGAYIPLNMVKIGKPLPIHHPPNINFGFLKYKVLKVTDV